MSESAADVVEAGKYVEVNYKVIDTKTGSVLTEIDQPLGYIHGVNQVMAPAVTLQLEGKSAGERVEVPLDCNKIYPPRDESLVFSEQLDRVPEEYHKVGTALLMENEAGQTRSFVVTAIQGTMITFDGNNPLSGREVIFKVDIVTVRDATEEQLARGDAVPAPGDG
jgi:FKBP-type peptidyl-prolyl cis-trans isomerase SlyD